MLLSQFRALILPPLSPSSLPPVSPLCRRARLSFQRLAPQVLVRLRINADDRQRSRYAAYLGARRVQKEHLVAWHVATVQILAIRRYTEPRELSMSGGKDRRGRN